MERVNSIVNVIDWNRLNEIVRKKLLLTNDYFENYEFLLKKYIINFIYGHYKNNSVLDLQSGSVVFERKCKLYNKNEELECQIDLDRFSQFLSDSDMFNLIYSELHFQLSPWERYIDKKKYQYLGDDARLCENKLFDSVESVIDSCEDQGQHHWLLAKIPSSIFKNIIIRILNVTLYYMLILMYWLHRFVLVFFDKRQFSVSHGAAAGNQNKYRMIINNYMRSMLLNLIPLVLPVVQSRAARLTETNLKLPTSIKSTLSNKFRISTAMMLSLYGRVLIGLGRHKEAYKSYFASFVWANERSSLLFRLGLTAQLSCQYADAEDFYRADIFYNCNESPIVFSNLGHVLLALNKEDEAVLHISRSIRALPQLSMPHHNLAARYDVFSYTPQLLDLMCDEKVIKYDAYYRIGERAVQSGEGEIGIQYYGKAIEQQIKLQKKFKLPIELLTLLERDYLVDPELPIRILPYEWVTLIGHIAMLDSYLKIKKTGLQNGNSQTILLAPRDKVANKAYLDLWKEHVRIITDPVMIDILFPYQRYCGDCFNGYIRPDGTSGDWTELGATGQIEWDRLNANPLIQITEEMDEKGWLILSQLGLRKTDWFVTLHMRGGGYHKESKYSIQTHRDSSISDYFEAIEAITKLGGWVIRVGDPSMPKLPPMKNVIDYVHSEHKSEWMDLFLAARSFLFVGTTSGLSNVVQSFGTHCLLVNCVSNYFQLWNKNVLFTFKPLWSLSENRYLSVSEMINESVRWGIFNINKMKEMKIVPQANTALEIKNAVIEAIERLKSGNWCLNTGADKALLDAYDCTGNWNYFGNAKLSQTFYEGRSGEHIFTVLENVENNRELSFGIR